MKFRSNRFNNHSPMNLRILSSALLLALLSPAPALLAQDAPPSPPASGEQPKAPKTELEKNMDAMAKAFRTLRRQVSDATKNESSLELVATIRTAATAAAKLTPAKAEDLPEADRPKFVEDFQAGMKDLLAGLDKLEADLKANDNTAAAADYKQIGSIEGKNHKQFRRPEKEKS